MWKTLYSSNIVKTFGFPTEC